MCRYSCKSKESTVYKWNIQLLTLSLIRTYYLKKIWAFPLFNPSRCWGSKLQGHAVGEYFLTSIRCQIIFSPWTLTVWLDLRVIDLGPCTWPPSPSKKCLDENGQDTLFEYSKLKFWETEVPEILSSQKTDTIIFFSISLVEIRWD